MSDHELMMKFFSSGSCTTSQDYTQKGGMQYTDVAVPHVDELADLVYDVNNIRVERISIDEVKAGDVLTIYGYCDNEVIDSLERAGREDFWLIHESPKGLHVSHLEKSFAGEVLPIGNRSYRYRCVKNIDFIKAFKKAFNIDLRTVDANALFPTK